MHKLLLIPFLFISYLSFGQLSDFILVKKPNGRTVLQLTAGNKIKAVTKDNKYYDGLVHQIKNDSITIKTWRINITYNQFGGAIIDTITFYYNKYHYNEIAKLKLNKRKKFIIDKSDKILKAAGAGYIVLDILNNARPGTPIFTAESNKRYGIAAAAIAAGFFIQKVIMKGGYSKKRHSIQYVKIT